MAVANDFATDSLFGGGPDGSPRELFAKMGLHLDPRTGGTSPEDARSIDMAMASIDAGIDNLFAGVPSMASLDEDAPAVAPEIEIESWRVEHRDVAHHDVRGAVDLEEHGAF